MTKAGKLIARMRANPSGWRLSTLETIARRNGIQVRKTGGRHHVFMHPRADLVVTIPVKRPIKPVYIVFFLALLDAIDEKETDA